MKRNLGPIETKETNVILCNHCGGRGYKGTRNWIAQDESYFTGYVNCEQCDGDGRLLKIVKTITKFRLYSTPEIINGELHSTE